MVSQKNSKVQRNVGEHFQFLMNWFWQRWWLSLQSQWRGVHPAMGLEKKWRWVADERRCGELRWCHRCPSKGVSPLGTGGAAVALTSGQAKRDIGLWGKSFSSLTSCPGWSGKVSCLSPILRRSPSFSSQALAVYIWIRPPRGFKYVGFIHSASRPASCVSNACVQSQQFLHRCVSVCAWQCVCWGEGDGSTEGKAYKS